jgi:hypothetical protein
MPYYAMVADLAVSLFLAVAAFAFSKLILPKQYQATALVILTKPIFSTNLDIRIEASPELPDAKSLTDLTRADDLLVEMIQAPEAGQLIPEEDRNPEMLRKRFRWH